MVVLDWGLVVVGSVTAALLSAVALDGWTTDVMDVMNVLCRCEVVDGCWGVVELCCCCCCCEVEVG